MPKHNRFPEVKVFPDPFQGQYSNSLKKNVGSRNGPAYRRRVREHIIFENRRLLDPGTLKDPEAIPARRDGTWLSTEGSRNASPPQNHFPIPPSKSLRFLARLVIPSSDCAEFFTKCARYLANYTELPAIFWEIPNAPISAFAYKNGSRTPKDRHNLPLV